MPQLTYTYSITVNTPEDWNKVNQNFADIRAVVNALDNTNLSPSAGIKTSQIAGFATVATSLPGAPYDGQVIVYEADATNGVYWQLRYRSASASSYKWEFIGGSPLFAEVPNNDATSSTSYVDVATPGPSVTVPLAGDYTTRHGMLADMAVGEVGSCTIKLGAAAAGDTERVFVNGPGAVSPHVANSVGRTLRLTGRAASDVLKLQYKASGTGSVSFSRRWIEVTPVRVG